MKTLIINRSEQPSCSYVGKVDASNELDEVVNVAEMDRQDEKCGDEVEEELGEDEMMIWKYSLNVRMRDQGMMSNG